VPSHGYFARRDAGTKKHKDLERLFDANWYLRRYPEAAAAAGGPLSHYLKSGAAAGYDPHPMFCTSWYLERYPDVASVGMNPLAHYVTHGAFEGRDPHPLFDTSWYLKQYPETSLRELNPLIDYIEHGSGEGRKPNQLFSGPSDWEMDQGVAALARAKYDWEIDRVPPKPRARRPARMFTSGMALVLSRLGKVFYRQSRFRLASLGFRAAYLISSARRDEPLAFLAKCAIRQGHFDQAFAWFVRRANLSPSSEPIVRATMPLVSKRRTTGGAVGVVTSFMPRRIEAQRAALQSWRAAGLSVVSVNSISEAVELRGHFPDVTFNLIDRPIEDIRGRPFVPIRAMIQAAKESSAEICGIINSDIEFRGDESFFDVVRREAPGALVFGNRIDVTDATARSGKAFRNGYDFFFWSRENSDLLEETPMVLGLPWWDFWLPMHAHSQGLKIKRLVTSAMIHLVHPIGWDTPNFVKMGQRCSAILASTYGRWSDESPPADRTFLHRFFATAATIPVERHPETALRRIGVVCDLVNCLIDALSETLISPDAPVATGTMDLV
jgi:hypothetical protein